MFETVPFLSREWDKTLMLHPHQQVVVNATHLVRGHSHPEPKDPQERWDTPGYFKCWCWPRAFFTGPKVAAGTRTVTVSMGSFGTRYACS